MLKLEKFKVRLHGIPGFYTVVYEDDEGRLFELQKSFKTVPQAKEVANQYNSGKLPFMQAEWQGLPNRVRLKTVY